MVWHRHVLPVTDPRYAAATSDTVGSSSSGSGDGTGSTQAGSGQPPGTGAATGEAAGEAAAGAGAGEPPVNRQLLAWGLSEQVARDAVNPGFAGEHLVLRPSCATPT